jgi:uncharacterized DUF497 family protein
MSLMIGGVDWDDGNWPKCGKHGVSRGEIEALFAGECAIYPDPAHSFREDRMLAIGTSAAGRFVLVAFTLRQRRGEMLIRPITARYMHGREVEHYERRGKA